MNLNLTQADIGTLEKIFLMQYTARTLSGLLQPIVKPKLVSMKNREEHKRKARGLNEQYGRMRHAFNAVDHVKSHLDQLFIKLWPVLDSPRVDLILLSPNLLVALNLWAFLEHNNISIYFDKLAGVATGSQRAAGRYSRLYGDYLPDVEINLPLINTVLNRINELLSPFFELKHILARKGVEMKKTTTARPRPEYYDPPWPHGSGRGWR